MKLISFRISGTFAAFRDPSVTSNQTVYYIPSKSAIIGMLGAIIGIRRSDKLGELYGEEYQKFFKKVKIGLQFESEPEKVTFFTNHRSLKEDKTKPFKTELLKNPTYTIYVSANEENNRKISNSITRNEFVYSPYLGHAYCPAIISNFKQFDVKSKIENPEMEKTRCVILDEAEAYNQNFNSEYEMITEDGSVIIERHIYHFLNDDGKLDGRVMKHWIPINNSELEIIHSCKLNLSEFYKIGEHVICMY